MQEVGNPICTQIDNPHAHGPSVAAGEVSRIQIRLEVRLHLEPISVPRHILKLWLLHQQPQAHGDTCVSLRQDPQAGNRGDADPMA